MSSLLGALMDAIVTFVPDALGSRSAFSIGVFNVSMAKLGLPCPCLVGMTVALLLQRELSILSMGDEVARNLSLRVNGYRLLFLCITCYRGAIFSGLLSFIGLIRPQADRPRYSLSDACHHDAGGASARGLRLDGPHVVRAL